MGKEIPKDVYHGWSLGDGNLQSEQGQMAVDFYASIVATGASNISLTGHSLGGGLAGFVGGVYGEKANIYDSMGYEAAIENAFYVSTHYEIDYYYSENGGYKYESNKIVTKDTLDLYTEDAVHFVTSRALVSEELKEQYFGDLSVDEILALKNSYDSYNGTKGFQINGEILGYAPGEPDNDIVTKDRFLDGIDLILDDYSATYNALNNWGSIAPILASSMVFDFGSNFVAEALARHSQASLIISMFSQESDQNVRTDWQGATSYFWPLMYDGNFASSIGFENPDTESNIYGELQRQGKYADILRMAIAYSAIDEGEKPFGDTAIRALYDDANDLGAAIAAAGAGSTIEALATDISKVFVNFAGQLALNDVEGIGGPVTQGVLDYDAARQYLTINVSDEAWSSYLNEAQRQALKDGLLDAIDLQYASSSFLNYTEFSDVSVVMPSELALDWQGKTSSDYNEYALIIAGANDGTYNAREGRALYYGSQGDDVFQSFRAADYKYFYGGEGNNHYIMHDDRGRYTAIVFGDPDGHDWIDFSNATEAIKFQDHVYGYLSYFEIATKLADVPDVSVPSSGQNLQWVDHVTLTQLGDTVNLSQPVMSGVLDAGDGFDTFTSFSVSEHFGNTYLSFGARTIEFLDANTALFGTDYVRMELRNFEEFWVRSLRVIMNDTFISFNDGRNLNADAYDFSKLSHSITFKQNTISSNGGTHTLNLGSSGIIATRFDDTIDIIGIGNVYAGLGDDTVIFRSGNTGVAYYKGGNDTYIFENLSSNGYVYLNSSIWNSDITVSNARLIQTDDYIASRHTVNTVSGTLNVDIIGSQIVSLTTGDNHRYTFANNQVLYFSPADEKSFYFEYGNEGAQNIVWDKDASFYYWARGGDDIVVGGNANNTLYGGTGNDQLYGGQDTDILYGGLGDDFLRGREQNDTLYGGDGYDTAIFSDSYAEYTVSSAYNGYIVDHLSGLGGRDTIYDVEAFQFADGIFDVATQTFTETIDPPTGGEAPVVNLVFLEEGGVIFGSRPDAAEINLASTTNKIQGVSFETGADVTSRQVIYEQGGSTRGLNFIVDGGKLYAAVWNKAEENWGYKELSYDIQADTKYTATLVMNGVIPANGQADLYVNGVLVDTVNGVGNLYAHGDNIGVGVVDGATLIRNTSTNSADFTGAIDKLAHYNGPLNPAELQQLNEYLAEDWLSDAPVNVAPIANDDTIVGDEDAIITGNVLSNDSDADGDVLSVSLLSDVTDGTLVLNSDGTFTYTPDADYFGSDSFSYTLSDGDLTDTAIVNITINAVAEPPTGPQAPSDHLAILLEAVGATNKLADNALINTSEQLAKTHAIAFETGADVTSPQVIYEQGGLTRGLNMFVDDSVLYAAVWNKAEENWGYHELESAIEANTKYTATLVMDGALPENGDAVLYLNGMLVDSASGIGKLYKHGDDIGIGEVQGSTLIHGSNTTSKTVFDGSIEKLAHYNAVLDGATLDQLHDYMAEEWLLDVLLEQVMMEFGSITAKHQEVTVDLTHSFNNPVVFMTMTTFNGNQIAAPRIVDVQDDSFTFYAQEAEYLDGAHANETFSYIVLEKGSWELSDGTKLEVGSLDTDVLSRNGFDDVSFVNGFEGAPAVFTQVQTNNDPVFVSTRQKGTDANGFDVALQEEELYNTGSHGVETIGWFAIDQGVGSDDGFDFIAGATGNNVTQKYSDVLFEGGFDDLPQLLASISTHDGGDASVVRVKNLGVDGFDVQIQEDQSKDTEINHMSEVIDYFAIEGTGLLTGMDNSGVV